MKPYYQDKYATIYHGDCLELLPEMPKVDLVLTDPPYNVSTKDISKGNGKYLKQNFGDWDNNFNPETFIKLVNLSENGQIYCFCSDGLVGNYCNIFNDLFGFFKLLVIWRINPCPQFRKRSYLQNQQYIAWARQGKYVFNFLGQTKMLACWQYKFNDEKIDHPNQKDTKVISKLIKISSDIDSLILDPFGGSCTTAVAAKQLNRKCITIEIEEKYCEIGAKRLSQEVLDLA